jgi:glyoxylase-like metal-dependent hydrolase (beta-lactamase superfamily II)
VSETNSVALQVGSAHIGRVEEQSFPVPFIVLTDDKDFIARRIAALPKGFLDSEAMTFTFSCHSWVIRVDGLTVLVDPCNGNGRKRGIPNFDDLDVPYLGRLAALGAPAETIDIVFCTHLHYDHCGWNTTSIDGRWVPTFPNASYVFVDTEYRRWDSTNPTRHPNDFNPSVFDECVRPIVEAGQAKIVSVPYAISPSLSVESAPGHTVGHSMLRLVSDGQRGYFAGDVLHHPAQVCRPELHLPGCDDLATAVATRRELFRRVNTEGALLFPAHFAAPHYGRVGLDGVEFVFLAGGARGAEGGFA